MQTHPNRQCPHCQCTYFTVKAVEIRFTSGCNTLLTTIEATECDQCGFRLMDTDNAAKCDVAYDQLKASDIASCTTVGRVYRQA